MAVALPPVAERGQGLLGQGGQKQVHEGHLVPAAVQGQGRPLAVQLLQPVPLVAALLAPVQPEPLVLLLLLLLVVVVLPLSVLQRRVAPSPERRAPCQRQRGRRHLVQ